MPSSLRGKMGDQGNMVAEPGSSSTDMEPVEEVQANIRRMEQIRERRMKALEQDIQDLSASWARQGNSEKRRGADRRSERGAWIE